MILFLANEPPWPVRNGGRARMAGLVGALRTAYDVDVVVAQGPRTESVEAGLTALPRSGRSRVGSVISAQPRLGRGLLDAAGSRVLNSLAQQANALVVSHSYLAAVLPPLSVPVIVDLPNLELHRQAVSSSPLDRIEAVKARRWEPAAARRAAAVVCVDEADAATVRGWGVQQVVVVPNVADVPLSPPSPDDGPVLAVADWRYGPNAQAMHELTTDVWPRVLAARPAARLVIAGRGSEDVPGGLGFVDDLRPLFDQASAFVSAVRGGAGTQLKIVEAVARGRVVVTTPYGARSLPTAAASHCLVGDLSEHLVKLLGSPADRHLREAALAAADLPRSWTAAAAPLLSLLAAVAGG